MKNLCNEQDITLTDQQLVGKWQQGDDHAFDLLYKRYAAGLAIEAARKTGCMETAKELVQDIFLYVIRHPQVFNPSRSIRGYLYTALRHQVYNHYRQLAVRQKHLQWVQAGGSNSAEDPLSQLQHKELSELVDRQVEKLPQQCRTVFRLSREEQLSYKEISERLNISVNTVEQHMRKALIRLRTSLIHYLYLLLLFPWL